MKYNNIRQLSTHGGNMKLSFKKTKNYPLYYFVAILCVLAAIVFAPIWSDTDLFFRSWGFMVTDITIAVLIFIYLFGYLIKKTGKEGNEVIRTLSIIEFIVISIIALGCVLSQFRIIVIGGPCQIVGAIMWARGVIEVLRAYYFRGSSAKYPVGLVLIDIALITFGTYLYLRPIFSEYHIQWGIVVFLVALAVIFTYAGIVTRPDKKRKK